MRKISPFLIIAFSFIINPLLITAQNVDTANVPIWIDMMQDPKANFFETQKAFEIYWQNRDRDKGDGWKVFKRWEDEMSYGVDEFGNKPSPGHIYNEYVKYFKSGLKSSLVDVDHWKEVGPVDLPVNSTGQPNGLGRVNCIGFHPSNQNIFYAGAPAGGLWRTVNHGQTWTGLTDTLPTLGVSAVVVDYTNPDVVYIGTGDRDNGNSKGLGVWKTTDGGVTWNPSYNGMSFKTVGKLIMNPLDNDILLAATSGGIYKSIDAGSTWVLKSSNTSHYKDLVYKPGDTSTVYAVTGGVFWTSSNGGETWTNTSTGLVTANRIVIGVTPANSNYVYLVLCNQSTFKGMYRSTNSGSSFTMMSNSPNIMDYNYDGSGSSGQAWYDLCVAVDRQNANTVYVGGVNIFKSTNGGITWTINAHWVGTNAAAVHADHHSLDINPLNNRLVSGNDGGVYYTSNGGSTWTDISDGLAIAQAYKIGQSATKDKLVINGYQDNGTAVFNGGWRTELGGDGMECIIDPTDTNYMYGAIYYGAIQRSTNNGGWFSGIKNNITESGEWVTPYILQENNPNVMIAGFKNIWISSNVKTTVPSSISWTMVSNNLGGVNNQGIKVLENSEADNNILFFSRKDNTLFRSDNIGTATPTFKNLTSGLPTATWPRDIEAHPTDPSKVWIVQSNKVYESSDTGNTWTDISGTLPAVATNCIVYDTSSAGDLYVGTDLNVFYKGSGMTDWIPYSGGLPYSVKVTELEIFYSNVRENSRLKAATFGRGLWSSPLYDNIVAEFDADEVQLCEGQSVQYNNHTEGLYTNVKWEFQGGTPSTSTLDNPLVTYNTHGTFNVSMVASSQYDKDSIFKTAYITVDTLIQVSVSPTSAVINAGDSVVMTASGATTYTWSPTGGLNTFKGAVVVARPSVSTVYTVMGSNPSCAGNNGQATSSITVNPVGLQENSFEGGQVLIYPNPVSDLLKIKFVNIHSNVVDLEILDMSGKRIHSEVLNLALKNDSYDLKVNGIKSGIYILILKTSEDQTTQRIVINHSF